MKAPAAIASMAGARVLPVRIDGALFSPFSRMRGKLRLRWFPKITLTFLPPVKFEQPEGVHGSALRQLQAEKLYDVMTDMMFKTSNIDRTLLNALLDARITHGGRIILEDIQRNPLSYNRVIMGSLVLGRKLAAIVDAQRKMSACCCPMPMPWPFTIFGLMALGQVPAMLNFSTGAVNMAAACTAAQVRTIVTSRKFIEAARNAGRHRDSLARLQDHLSRRCSRARSARLTSSMDFSASSFRKLASAQCASVTPTSPP